MRALVELAKRRGEVTAEDAGVPLEDVEVRIAADGEILARGPNVMQGYHNRPEETEAVLQNGTLRTGDIGYLDEEGDLFLVQRRSDLIVTGGENVYPAEVEQVISQLEAVGDVAVIGVPHERWGETGRALVVKERGSDISEDAILAHCAANLARFKVPQSVEFVDELPRNAAGKVLKRTLRNQYVDETDAGPLTD